MSQQTGEDELGLHKILDFFRMGGIIVLLLHFYYFACPVCLDWQTQQPIADRLISSVANTGLFTTPLRSKVIALVFLAISLLGARGKKSPDNKMETGLFCLFSGLLLYFACAILEFGPIYILLCSIGYLLILYGSIYLTRVIWHRPEPDIFNKLHESFPQQETLVANAYSINLPANYLYQGRLRDSWVNIPDPFRGTLILGSPGSGKTRFFIEPLIRIQIQKAFSMLVYDFKYPDLSRLAFNYFQQYRSHYPGKPAFYTLHPGDPDHSHRANPIHRNYLDDIHDAGEAAHAVLLGMAKSGIGQQGEFFLDSSINFVQALIWYLRSSHDAKYCSWPHVIELAQVPYTKLFPVLSTEPQLIPLVTPFINAYKKAPEMLDGQIATATIRLARLASPAIYYIMSGDDFSLDLNHPEAPKVLTIGTNPPKAATYGPIISAYINTINRLANRKDMHPFSEVLEEFSTISVHTIDRSIATGRSNRMAITLCLQNADQLRLAYGKEFADVVLNTVGNIISGQASGETAKWLSERFSRTNQPRESLTSTATDLHITQSHQLEPSIPTSRIASLSSGEFVGMIADTPDQPIDLKTFCCRFRTDPEAFETGSAASEDLPVLRHVTHEMLMANFIRIRSEIETLVNVEMARISATPELQHLLLE